MEGKRTSDDYETNMSRLAKLVIVIVTGYFALLAFNAVVAFLQK